MELSCVLFGADLAYIGLINVPQVYRFLDVLNQPSISSSLLMIDKNDILRLSEVSIFRGEEMSYIGSIRANRRNVVYAYDKMPRMGDERERLTASRTQHPEIVEIFMDNSTVVRGISSGFQFKRDTKMFIAISEVTVHDLDGKPDSLIGEKRPFLAVNTLHIIGYRIGEDIPTDG
jgi:hypothetical protein